MSQPSFSAFYEAMHGYATFPWQVRLAERAAAGQWPTALNLPTASGKTAVVDVWLWAHTVGVAGTPRRLYYVIDRRLLVDAVADYAQALVAQCPLLPVSVVRLRGGMGAAEDAWMLNPGGLALVSTTLDQVGSRLLCRAYGSSRWTAPTPLRTSAMTSDPRTPRISASGVKDKRWVNTESASVWTSSGRTKSRPLDKA